MTIVVSVSRADDCQNYQSEIVRGREPPFAIDVLSHYERQAQLNLADACVIIVMHWGQGQTESGPGPSAA